MEMEQVPAALQERLGLEATSGLLQLFEASHREMRSDVIAACAERFERRLVEEISGTRVQVAQVEGSIHRDMAEMRASLRQEIAEVGARIRQEMAEMGASIRKDMTEMGASIRQDMTEMGATLRQEMAQMEAGLRRDMGNMEVALRGEIAASAAGIHQEIANGRVELLKWCFLFWVGQVFAVAGIMGVMLRIFRP